MSDPRVATGDGLPAMRVCGAVSIERPAPGGALPVPRVPIDLRHPLAERSGPVPYANEGSDSDDPDACGPLSVLKGAEAKTAGGQPFRKQQEMGRTVTQFTETAQKRYRT